MIPDKVQFALIRRYQDIKAGMLFSEIEKQPYHQVLENYWNSLEIPRP
jgi:hypothetical protein